MSFDMPAILKIRLKADCPTHSRTEISARQHKVLIDEPPSRNGTDLAQSPLETLLSSFLGCTNVVANVIAEEMGIVITEMELELVGHFDTQGFLGTAEIDTQFPQIELTADIKTDASPAQIDELKTRLAKRCPVSAILRKSGTEVIETWNIVGS
ncbi:MAG: OsmC family protein [Alphaproteobacteria bacterium]|nr:OsmC family protein [Alphaproteobacteria bacterium]MCZ6511902.1 OsmC family protein [Alphaproteobacteria bacterium]MCZ6839423.1 OsmC family protein [Alphaproteobacteria bacterium]